MSVATELLTAQEFAVLPGENGFIMELVRGEVVRMCRPKPKHGRIAMRIGSLLYQHARTRRLGEVFAADTGFLLERDPDTVRGPDASFVSNARLAQVTDPDDYYPVVPDLAVEVTSPDDRRPKIDEKIADWLGAGVRLLWQVNPDSRTVEVHRPGAETITLNENDTLDGLDVLPGFTCRVGELFG